jgi:transcriptional regulator with XRE-family HTH domain
VAEPPGPFADALRRLRAAAGLTQEALAGAAGLSSRAISDLERGMVTAPHKDTVRLLAEALHLDSRPWTWPAPSPSPGTKLTPWPAWPGAPWPPAALPREKPGCGRRWPSSSRSARPKPQPCRPNWTRCPSRDGCRLTSPGNPADGAIALTDSSAMASRC